MSRWWPLVQIMKNITPAIDQPPAQPDKPKRISTKVRAAIEAMVNGEVKTIADAARSAGLCREHLSRELSKPHIAEHMRQRVVRSLSVASARAGAVKVALLDGASEHVRDNASTFVLGLAGIKPETAPTISLNIAVKAGYVIDLSDDPPKAAQSPVIDLTPLRTG
jgi:hypothetical protein